MSEKRGMQTNTHQLHLDLDILHSLYIIGGNPEDLLLSDTYFFTYISFIVGVLILFVFQKQTIYSCFCCLLCDWYFKFCGCISKIYIPSTIWYTLFSSYFPCRWFPLNSHSRCHIFPMLNVFLLLWIYYHHCFFVDLLLALLRALPGDQTGVLQHPPLPHQEGRCLYWGNLSLRHTWRMALMI